MMVVRVLNLIHTSICVRIYILFNRDLSNNHITVLPPDVFSSLSRLATLIVSYNKLQCVQSQAFSGITIILYFYAISDKEINIFSIQ